MASLGLPNDEPGARHYTGRDALYGEGSIGFLDVQRAADALLRQGIKPSVAAIRDQLGGGSPNTITPLLGKYWETLGRRLADGPESLERVPEALARVTELLWRRALEEARERLKSLGKGKELAVGLVQLQEQVGKLSLALAEARAREGEQLSHLASLSKEQVKLRGERGSLVTLLKSSQALLEQQNARVAVFEAARNKLNATSAQSPARSRGRKRKTTRTQAIGRPAKRATGGRTRRGGARKPK